MSRLTRWGKKAPEPSVAVSPGSLLGAMMTRAQAQVYADGMADGVEMSLRLLLGDESTEGGVPFRGVLPADARKWAEDALANVAGARREMRGILS